MTTVATSQVPATAGCLATVQTYLTYLTYRTQFGFINDTAQTLLSIAACIVYIAQTYIETRQELPLWIFIAEYLFFTIFALDYLLSLFIAESKIAYAFGRQGLVDFASLTPIILLHSDGQNGFVRIFRVFRILRILRSYRGGGFKSEDDSINRQIGVFCFFVTRCDGSFQLFMFC